MARKTALRINEGLTHARGEGRLWMLPALAKAGVESSDSDYKVGASGGDRGHVEYTPVPGRGRPGYGGFRYRD